MACGGGGGGGVEVCRTKCNEHGVVDEKQQQGQAVDGLCRWAIWVVMTEGMVNVHGRVAGWPK